MTLTTSRTPTLEELLRLAVDQRLADVHVALPGRVETYDLANQVADIKPLLKRGLVTDDGEDIVESIPIIPSVPILLPRAGGFFISLPLNSGDFVLLLFNERSIDKWFSGSGDETDPVDLRAHSLSDAVAVPCFYPLSGALSVQDISDNSLVLGKEGGPQTYYKDTEILIGSKNATEFAAQAQKTLTELTAIINDFNLHTHPTPAGPSSTPTTPMPAAASVAATKVKVD